MRALIAKVVTGSMIAGAALMISACQPKTETTTNDAMVANTTEDAMASDNMTAADGAMNATDGAMASNDAMMTSNDAMASNDAMTTNAK